MQKLEEHEGFVVADIESHGSPVALTILALSGERTSERRGEELPSGNRSTKRSRPEPPSFESTLDTRIGRHTWQPRGAEIPLETVLAFVYPG